MVKNIYPKIIDSLTFIINLRLNTSFLIDEIFDGQVTAFTDDSALVYVGDTLPKLEKNGIRFDVPKMVDC